MSTHDFTDEGGDTGSKNGRGGSGTRQDPGVAILDFQTFGILTVDGVKMDSMRRRTKFRGDWRSVEPLQRYGDLTVFKIAPLLRPILPQCLAVSILHYVPNLNHSPNVDVTKSGTSVSMKADACRRLVLRDPGPEFTDLPM